MLRRHYLKSSKKMDPRRWWKQRCLRSQFRRTLLKAYNGDIRKYMAAYVPFAEAKDYQECGMEDFVRLERRLLGQMRWESLKIKGRLALGTFEGGGEADDMAFVAIDFEGGQGGSGTTETSENILEFGLASFLPGRRQNGRVSEGDIETEHYILQKRSPSEWRRFRFGESQPLSISQLRERILERINGLSGRNCKIMLVGHGVRFDLETLLLLEINVSDLPAIYGIVDTYSLSQEALGFGDSLGRLLQTLSIPSHKESLHCTGNDANFALRLLLRLMSMRYDSCAGRWHSIVMRPLPRPKSWDKKEKVDWFEHVGDAFQWLAIEA